MIMQNDYKKFPEINCKNILESIFEIDSKSGHMIFSLKTLSKSIAKSERRTID